MKMNGNFAKKAMIAASLTAGIVGFNSLFNETQATGGGDYGYYFKKCTYGKNKPGGECTASVGNCAVLSSCG